MFYSKQRTIFVNFESCIRKDTFRSSGELHTFTIHKPHLNIISFYGNWLKLDSQCERDDMLITLVFSTLTASMQTSCKLQNPKESKEEEKATTIH